MGGRLTGYNIQTLTVVHNRYKRLMYICTSFPKEQTKPAGDTTLIQFTSSSIKWASEFENVFSLAPLKSYPCFFYELCDHDNLINSFLPYHLPEVCNSIWLWTWQKKKQLSVFVDKQLNYPSWKTRIIQ